MLPGKDKVVRSHRPASSSVSAPTTSSLNRRHLLALAAAGLTVGRVRDAHAQENPATPGASPVPGATPVAVVAPQKGGALQLVRPGDTLENLNPAAFLVD